MMFSFFSFTFFLPKYNLERYFVTTKVWDFPVYKMKLLVWSEKVAFITRL